MSKSALKHNQNMQQQGAMGKITSIARRGLGTPASPANPVPQHLLGGVNTPNNIDATADPIELQKAQVAEASGLNRLTQGPLGGLGAYTPFANKSPLKLAEVTSKDFSEYNQAYAQGSSQGVLQPDTDGDGVSDTTEAGIETSASLANAAQSIISNLQGKNEKKEKTTRKQRLQAKIDSTDNPAKKERMQGRLDRINMRQKGRAARGKIKNKLQGQFVQGAQNIKNKLWGVDNENSEVEVNTENKELLKHDLNNLNNPGLVNFTQRFGGNPGDYGNQSTYKSEMEALDNEYKASHDAWSKGEGDVMSDDILSQRIGDLQKKYNVKG